MRKREVIVNHIKYFAWLVPLEFYLKQNQYFGWNAIPKSDAELIADGLTFVLVVLTAIFIQSCKNPTATITFIGKTDDNA